MGYGLESDAATFGERFPIQGRNGEDRVGHLFRAAVSGESDEAFKACQRRRAEDARNACVDAGAATSVTGQGSGDATAWVPDVDA